MSVAMKTSIHNLLVIMLYLYEPYGQPTYQDVILILQSMWVLNSSAHNMLCMISVYHACFHCCTFVRSGKRILLTSLIITNVLKLNLFNNMADLM